MFDYTFQWRAAWRALPDMLQGAWVTFETAALSMVVAPFRTGQEKIVGAIGVIGPTRINYGRVIPVVDYTARVIGRLLG